MGFYITTFLLGGLTIGSAATASAAEAKKDEKSEIRADNTKKNENDREGNKPTADDQQNDQISLKLTSRIRRALRADESLSMNANNVKIISLKDKVTLRGPVNSEEEKAKVHKIACDIAGHANVTNDLEVLKK